MAGHSVTSDLELQSRLKLAIKDSVEKADLSMMRAWNDLDVLSNRTQVDQVQVDPEAISIDNDKFSGVATVYVMLNYGDGGEIHETADSFIGLFKGHLSEGGPALDDFTVDTSPFFEGETSAED